MNEASFDLHVLILSEDSSDTALPSLRALAKGMLRLVDPSYRMDRVDLEPEGEEAQRAAHANLCLGENPAAHRKLVIVARAVARHIVAERGVVLYHIDADQVWLDRHAPTIHLTRFQEKVTALVSRVVDELLAEKEGATDKATIMSRLCLVSPYWCIESWLYQNTTVAKALCHKHHGGRHADRFDHWAQFREELDETDKPNHQICLSSKHNEELASKGFPARAVYDTGKSFFATVERLKASPTLVAALAATHPGY